MTPALRYGVLSGLSGLGWGIFVWQFIFDGMPPALPGGVIASPAIGLAIGLAAKGWNRWPIWLRITAALISLYAATLLFGLAVGIYDWQFGDMTNRIPYAVVLEDTVGLLWGLTFTGYLLILWPLAYLNHWLLGRTLPFDR